MDYVSFPDYATNFVNWADVAAFEPPRKEPENSRAARKIQTISGGVPDFFEIPTGLEAPTTFQQHTYRPEQSHVHTNVVGEPGQQRGAEVCLPIDSNEIDRIANQRVKLLALRYASSKQSAELVARLEILNQRLLDRSPRISAEQVNSLEDAAALIAASYNSREDRMRRLGIKA